MYISQKHISRRTILKGVGASIALPLLDAMSPAAMAAAKTAAGTAPKRFAFVGFPHGAIMDRWSPKQTGAEYEMSTILEPLAPFRQHMTIVSGLRNKPGETPEPHAYIESTWLNCVKPWEHGLANPDAGVTADQLAAAPGIGARMSSASPRRSTNCCAADGWPEPATKRRCR